MYRSVLKSLSFCFKSAFMNYQFSELACAHGVPQVKGRLKVHNEDFIVDEVMPIVPSGEGEHLWLKIKKDGSNTDWVAQQLAKWASVKAMHVSYAGMKDRHAVTTQWFSLHLPGLADPDFSTLDSEEFQIIEASRHDRKLKRGALSGNRFTLRVTDLQGDTTQLDSVLQGIQQQGVPNYFGEQRFGREMANLDKALKMFNGTFRKLKKQQRGLYLSAARSWLFNQLLSQRIQQQSWLAPLSGEVYMLNNKTACFVDEDPEQNFQRMQDNEINLTGCLWGEGESMARQQVLALESSIAEEYEDFARGLESARLKQERRSLRLIPQDMQWSIDGATLNISFTLPAGAFATMVLRECIEAM